MAIIRRTYRTKKQQKPITYYQVEVFAQGVRVLVKNFPTKREAVLWHEQEKRKFIFSPSSLKNEMRFKECLDEYCKAARNRLMKSTFQKYEALLIYLYSGPLAKVKMSELNSMKVVEWLQWLRQHPTVKNPIRKNFIHELKLLSAILNWYRNFLNEDFNVPITKKHKEMCFFKTNAPRRPDHYMRPDDVSKWVEWLKEHRSNPVYWRLAVFMLSTGTRIGETCGLKWEELDLKQGTARIIRRVRWDHYTRRPFLEDVMKTAGSVRLVMLPGQLRNILKDMKKKAINDLVFTDLNGEIVKYNAIQSSFNAGFEALGLPWRSTHILRHTFATVALMETKNISAVQASLGHTEMRMTQRYAKTVALLNSETGEKTFSALFKNSRL